MDQRRTLIRDFEREISGKKQEIKDFYVSLGEYLFENYKKETRMKAQEDYDAVKRNREQNEQYVQMKERIGEITARLEDLTSELTETVSRLEGIERSHISVYENIGIAAYRLLLEDASQIAPYREIFKDVEDHEQDIRGIDQEIDNLQRQSKEKKFFEKLADRGQATYLRGVKLVRQKALPKMYQDIGKELTKTDFLEKIDNKDILQAAAPFLQNRDQLKELTEKRDELKGEKEQLQKELNSLGVERRPEKRLEELEENISTSRQKTKKRLENIASKVRKEPSEKMKGDKEIKAFIGQIEAAEDKIEKYGENIKKLEAAIEADTLARQITRMKESIGEHEHKIEEHKNEIAELESKIGEAEKEKKRLEGIRGSEEIKLTS